MTVYDDNNIFARILRGELPCNKILETDHALAFHDINPQAPVHALVLPKGPYKSMDDFTANASAVEIAGLWQAVGEVARALDLVPGGYRIIANHGACAHQEVFHLHIHVLGGQPLGPMIEGGAVPPDGTWNRAG
jgi:diadenosine tetraphosphate (Ap4A) HIT family hydrolase